LEIYRHGKLITKCKDLMSIQIDSSLLDQLHRHLETAYPHEGAGFLLGNDQAGLREVTAILNLSNAREEEARFNRFLLTPSDYLRGEQEADRLGLTVLGVFHSHPDCPNRPSEFDREWAMPWFSYLITRVNGTVQGGSTAQNSSGQAVSDLCWRLEEDREHYAEEKIWLISPIKG
jgi:proteasome lid subunit RPN8/RPN11